MMRRMLLASALAGACFTVTPHASAEDVCVEAQFSRPTTVNISRRCVPTPVPTGCARSDYVGDLLMGYTYLCLPDPLVPERG